MDTELQFVPTEDSGADDTNVTTQPENDALSASASQETEVLDAGAAAEPGVDDVDVEAAGAKGVVLINNLEEPGPSRFFEEQDEHNRFYRFEESDYDSDADPHFNRHLEEPGPSRFFEEQDEHNRFYHENPSSFEESDYDSDADPHFNRYIKNTPRELRAREMQRAKLEHIRFLNRFEVGDQKAQSTSDSAPNVHLEEPGPSRFFEEQDEHYRFYHENPSSFEESDYDSDADPHFNRYIKNTPRELRAREMQRAKLEHIRFLNRFEVGDQKAQSTSDSAPNVHLEEPGPSRFFEEQDEHYRFYHENPSSFEESDYDSDADPHFNRYIKNTPRELRAREMQRAKLEHIRFLNRFEVGDQKAQSTSDSAPNVHLEEPGPSRFFEEQDEHNRFYHENPSSFEESDYDSDADPHFNRYIKNTPRELRAREMQRAKLEHIRFLNRFEVGDQKAQSTSDSAPNVRK